MESNSQNNLDWLVKNIIANSGHGYSPKPAMVVPMRVRVNFTSPLGSTPALDNLPLTTLDRESSPRVVVEVESTTINSVDTLGGIENVSDGHLSGGNEESYSM